MCIALRVSLGAAIFEQPGHGGVAPSERQFQRRASVLRRSVDVGAIGKQQRDRICAMVLELKLRIAQNSTPNAERCAMKPDRVGTYSGLIA